MSTNSNEQSCTGYQTCSTTNSKAEQSLMDSLPDRHLIRILMCEHQEIRARLDELESLADKVSIGEGDLRSTFAKMKSIGEQLIAAEPHHRREEEILFAELKRRGVEGPTSVMLAEHVNIRTLKHFIRDESNRLLEVHDRPTNLLTAARELIADLRTHINKENGVLYPMSLGVLRSQELWDEMLKKSDAIGYCCTAH